MKPLTNRWALGGIGTTGTEIRDKRVANPRIWWALGLVLVACGGESKQGDDNDSSSSTGSDCSGQAQVIDPGCFGSAGGGSGEDTTGTTTTATGGGTTVGSSTGTTSGSSGGTTSGSNDSTTSVSTDGSSGAGGAGGTPNCEPQDVAGVGACDAAFGVFFLGDRCGWVGGCSCEGDDCDNAYEDEASCEAAHRECFDDGCAAQDITLVGGCEPASVYMFNGFECVAMDGCSCVGDDCDAVYTTPEDCEAEHAVCKDRALSCDDIEAAYDDYVSHTACQDDSDCTMVYGLCGIGLGGCYHVVNRRWSDSGLEALSEAWSTRDCGGGVCACAEPPETVVCDDGVCAFEE